MKHQVKAALVISLATTLLFMMTKVDFTIPIKGTTLPLTNQSNTLEVKKQDAPPVKGDNNETHQESAETEKKEVINLQSIPETAPLYSPHEQEENTLQELSPTDQPASAQSQLVEIPRVSFTNQSDVKKLKKLVDEPIPSSPPEYTGDQSTGKTNDSHSKRTSKANKLGKSLHRKALKSKSDYPDWWVTSWPRSAVSGSLDWFVGDQPLFPPCTSNPKRHTYPFVEPQSYLPNSKNPCWYEQPKQQKGLHCVPYIYLAGVAKCGTSDISRRLRLHPDVFYGTQKEYHWWERTRYGGFVDDRPLETVSLHGGRTFRDYTNDITGHGIANLQQELRSAGSSVKIFGDYSPSYLWDPRNWAILDGNQGCLEPRVIVGQHIRHIYLDAKIIMTFRHPTPRLYSRFMSRIPRTPELRKASVRDFHSFVADGIKAYKGCFKIWSIRHCAYNVSLYKNSKVRLVEGMYPVFMADWLRVWPKKQMLLLRYEDYGGNEKATMKSIYNFLGLAELNSTQWDQILEIEVVNSGSEEYSKYGSMLPGTKKLLDDFYRPFVLQFAQLLKDEKFLWLDKYQ